MNKTTTVLIVDDTLSNIELLSEMLSDSYIIRTAQSGKEALSIMRTESIDIVLLDVVMPGLNGCEVLEQMKAEPELRTIPVVVITSESNPQIKERALSLGAVDFVPRGTDMTALNHRISAVLRLCGLDKIRAEHERMTRELQTEKHLCALMDNIPGGVAVLNTDGSAVSCSFFNNGLLDLLGLSAEEFHNCFDRLFPAEWVSRFIEEASLENNFSYIFEKTFGDNPLNSRWIRLIASKLGERDGKSEIYCVFLDVTDQKQHELRAEQAGQQLRTQENRFETLLNTSPGGIAYAEHDQNGKVHTLFASRGLADMLGYPDRESCAAELNDNPSAGISEDDVFNVKLKISQALRGNGCFKHSFGCTTKDGKELWLMMRVQLVMINDGGKERLSLYSFITDITKEKKTEDDLRLAAYFDPLTGLYNRRAFLKNAQRMLDDKQAAEFSVMKLDIANFKVINDILGRDVGDKILITIGDVLRTLIGGNGVYARFFADNFFLMIPYNERAVHPQAILDAVQKAIIASGVISHEIQIYIGVYKTSDRSLTAENMADRASLACRSVNGSFREHIAYYDEKIRREMLERQQITDESRRALENHEFYICYQPVYGIKAKKFVSAEALVRWNHPTKGIIPPTKFIPVFEKNGFIAELDLYVLEQVCIYQKKRRDNGLPPFPISVNVSRMSLYNPNLFSIISDLTNKYQVDPEYFRIEITESAYNDNPSQLLETIGRLRGKCYPVLMDDFGSGYSSLNTLKDIPIDILKLDMKFMQGFEKNGKVGTIVTAISRMSKWLNVPMLAEGVETKEQYDFLVSIGCAYIQGFYFSRPVPEKDFTDLVAMEEITAVGEPIESYGMGDSVNELLGSNSVVSKFIGSVFGGLGIYEMINGRLELIRVNEGYAKIMGYSASDLDSGNIDIWKCIHPDDVEISKNACMEALRTDKAVRTTVRRYDKNGKLLHLDGIHRRLGGSNDHPIFCIAFNDINDKLRSDLIIERDRDRTEEIINATGSVAVDIDYESGNVFFVGSWDYDVHLDTIDTYTGKDGPFAKVVHPEDAAMAERLHEDRTPGKISVEMRLKANDGEYYWWRITIKRYFNADGKMLRLVGVGTNIDEQKKIRLELEEANNNIDAAMSNLTVGMLFLEMSAESKPHVLYANDIFWKTIGKSRTDDDRFFETVQSGVEKDDLQRIIEAAKIGSVKLEYPALRDDGKSVWIEFTLAPSHSVKDKSRVYMAMVSDVTDRHEQKSRIDAIIRSFNGGVALISKFGERISVDFANERFYDIIGVKKENTDRVSQIVSAVFASKNATADLRIHCDGTDKIVRVHVDKTDPMPRSTQCSYIITVKDVTLRRAEAKYRIAERMSYASVGMYDEVFEISLRNRTIKLLSSKRMPDKANNSTAFPISAVLKEWSEKYAHPDDMPAAMELFNCPQINPDFTDVYHEIRMKDIYGNGEYHKFGMVIVRSKPETCMLFVRDMERMDESTANEQMAEMDRTYRLLAEQTHTTVIECDYRTGIAVCSPSIKEFYSPVLGSDEPVTRDRIIHTEAVHPDDRQEFLSFTAQLGSADQIQGVTVRMMMANGEYKWCRIVVSLMKNERGEDIKFLCTISQIHEEVLARQKAEESDKMLRRTVRNIPVGVGIFRLDDGEPVPIFLSDNIYSIYGLERGDIKAPVLPIEQLTRENKLYDGAEGEYALEAYRADGTKFWLSINYRVIAEDGNLILYASLGDISDRVLSMRHETAEEQMYQVLLSESATILFEYITDNDTFTYFSRGEDGRRISRSITNLFEHADELTLLDLADKTNFIMLLKKLLNEAGSCELPVRITVDGYPRRHKIFMKGVSDSDGKVFEIIGKMEDVEDELARLEKIQTKAMYDSLCVDIFNKATTEELIRGELEHSTGGALLMIDIDDFKRINDNLGHMFGDEFLKKFASTVKSVFRDTDIVGRYGGDEFFVFMPHVSASLAEKKGRVILERVTSIDVPLPGGVKSSVGLSAVTPENRNYSQLLRQADSALYQAKNRGKNCVVTFDPATMTEGSYRTTEKDDHSTSQNVVLSSNPNNAASTFMRVFSALYTCADFNDGITRMLELVGKTYDVSRAYIFENSSSGEFTSNTYEWCADGVSSEIDTLQNLSYDEDLGGNYSENFNDDGIFYCHDVSELTNEKTRKNLEQQNIKSLLQCSIMDGGKFKGFVGFDECRSNRFWTQEQIDSLVFISHVLSIFLMKERQKGLASASDKTRAEE